MVITQRQNILNIQNTARGRKLCPFVIITIKRANETFSNCIKVLRIITFHVSCKTRTNKKQ